MLKLLTRYIDNPTDDNARKVRNHYYKHPMSGLILTEQELALMWQVIARAVVANATTPAHLD